MLSFMLHTRIGEQDLLLPVAGHIVFTTVAGQGWLAGHIALSGCTWTYSRPRSDNQAFERSGKFRSACLHPGSVSRDRLDSAGWDRAPKAASSISAVRRFSENLIGAILRGERVALKSKRLALGSNLGSLL